MKAKPKELGIPNRTPSQSADWKVRSPLTEVMARETDKALKAIVEKIGV